MKTRSGRWWVAGLMALGGAAGLVGVTYWKSPANSVRWSFTQIHSSLARGKRENAARLVADRVTWRGRTTSGEEFIRIYTLPARAGTIEALPAPSAPGCWKVLMGDLVYAFAEDGPVWKLYWVGTDDPPPPTSE